MAQETAPTAATAPRSRQGEARRADGERTRDQLMDAAEELFASRGVEAVSVRSVNAAAGLAAASVHYHFGDKDGLLRKVIARRGGDVVARQAELLDALEAAGRQPGPETAVRVLAEPLFELLRREPVGGARWIAIVAGLVASDDERVYRIGFGPGSVQERINAAVASAFPDEDRDVVAERWLMASTSLLQLIADSADRLTAPDEQAAREAFDVIVRFVAHGLEGVCRTAPATAAP
jgi:AcrR family transcriptional regulator